MSPRNSPDSSPYKLCSRSMASTAIYARGDPERLREESERKNIKKREHISMMKSLMLALISTASIGKLYLNSIRNQRLPRARPLSTRIQNWLSLSFKESWVEKEPKFRDALGNIKETRYYSGRQSQLQLGEWWKKVKRPATVMKRKRKQTRKKNFAFMCLLVY